jgi:cell division protein ZapE
MTSFDGLSPRQRYERDLARPDFRVDAAQAIAVEHLQLLYEQLVSRWQQPQAPGSWRQWLTPWRKTEPAQAVRGLYFWGAVKPI